jgi:hypothetical protein
MKARRINIVNFLEEDRIMSGTKYVRHIRSGLRFMRVPKPMKFQEGKIGYILLWLLGVPIPILILIFLLRGCN